MVSFKLFPSIPPTQCIPFVENIFFQSGKLTHSCINDTLVIDDSLFIDQNFFQFKDTFYTQTDGLAIWALAKIFRSSIELLL